MTVAPHPIDLVRSRLHVVSGRPHAFRAKCPAHGSRGGTRDGLIAGQGGRMIGRAADYRGGANLAIVVIAQADEGAQ